MIALLERPRPLIEVDPVADRVREGATLLDATMPGWWEAIDRTALDMAAAKECVLGQLYGDYTDGLEDLFASRCSMQTQLGIEYGFSTIETDQSPRWDFLRGHWDAEIRQRLGEVA